MMKCETIKILMAGWYPLDADKLYGGPYYNTYLQVRTLIEHPDVRIEVITRSQDCKQNRTIYSDGLIIHVVAEPSSRIVPRQYTMVAKVARAMQGLHPDIVISHNRIETLAAHKAGLPTVYIRHGITRHETRLAHGFDKLVGILGDMVERKALRSVGDVICISDYGIRASCEETSAKIHKISYPIVEDEFFSCPEYSSEKGVLFAGVINPLKNLLTLIEAWPAVLSDNPQAHLRVCGRVSDKHYLLQVQERIASLGIEDSVELLGLVGRCELMNLMRDSACLVLPSRQENMPNVISQSLACGRPVIATAVGGIPEMVDDGVTGFILDTPDNVGGFADRIGKLLSNPALTRQMGNAGKQAALKRFERHAHIEQLLNICKKAMASQQVIKRM
ncbi:MAG: glycosyltransferase family 4 protein [Armatimonadota bacterium]